MYSSGARGQENNIEPLYRANTIAKCLEHDLVHDVGDLFRRSSVLTLVCVSFADWQWGIIGAMAFSMCFAILAIALSACGVFAATLSRKIYYYHSAGEIYVISGIVSGLLLSLRRGGNLS